MDFEITKREVIASISILAIMLILGILIGDKVNDMIQDDNARYYKAYKINEDEDLFKYCIDTNVGNAFVYGELKAKYPITHKNVKGKYMILEEVREEYTMHTRTVTYTVNGKTKTKLETYWTWDRVGSETYQSKEILFLGKTFKISKFRIPDTTYIDTVSGGYHIRYKYYGLEPNFKATLFCDLRNNDIGKDRIDVYRGRQINETLEYLANDSFIYVYWFLWICLTIGVIYMFYYADNKWLYK